MGIFRRLLKKEEKVDPAAGDDRDGRDARMREDPLPDEQDQQAVKPPASRSRPTPPLFGKEESVRPSPSSPRLVEAFAPSEVVGNVPPDRQRPDNESVAGDTIDLMHAKLSEAEGILDIAEEQLGRAEGMIPSGDRILAEVKIKLLEAKITLSELAITLAAFKGGGQGVGQGFMALAGPITEAEGKLAFAEKRLGSIKVHAGEVQIRVVEVKIKISEAKIRLSQAKLLMHGEEPAPLLQKPRIPPPPSKFPPVPEPSPEPVPPEPVLAPEPVPVVRKPVSPTILQPVQLHEEVPETPEEPDHLDENPGDLQDAAGRTGAGIKKIKFDPPKMAPEESDFGISLDPVKIRGRETDILKDDPVISLKKLDISPSEQTAVRVEQPSTLEKVKIHSSDVGIVAEKPVTGMTPPDTEIPKVVIKETDIERRLVIDDLNQKGVELRKQGRYDEAVDCFDRILEIDPDSMAANNNKGVALRTMGRYQDAEPYLAKVVGLDASNAGAWFNLGFVQFKLGKFTEANEALDKVLELSPTHAVAWDSKGKVLQKLGREAEAGECFARAKELNAGS